MIAYRMIAMHLALVAGSAPAQTFHKCTGADGTVTYAQSQCTCAAATATVTVSTPRADLQRTDQRTEAEDLAQQCLPFVTFRFKDPSSARIEQVGVMKLDTMSYEGATILAYKLPIWVNAKNSYGGYTGSTMYYCYIAQNDKSILRVDPP